MNIFVKKLSYKTNEADLQAAFERFGTVTSCNIVMDERAKRSKGFGFVEMLDDKEADKAIATLNLSKLHGNKIVVKETKIKKN